MEWRVKKWCGLVNSSKLSYIKIKYFEGFNWCNILKDLIDVIIVSSLTFKAQAILLLKNIPKTSKIPISSSYGFDEFRTDGGRRRRRRSSSKGRREAFCVDFQTQRQTNSPLGRRRNRQFFKVSTPFLFLFFFVSKC